MQTITLSEASTTDDCSRIAAFINKQASPYIIIHSSPELETAAGNGLFFKVEDEHGIIVGTGYIVPIEHLPYFEVANTLVAPEWQGFGLQSELLLISAATIIAQAEDSRLVAAINPKKLSIASYRNESWFQTVFRGFT